MTSECKLETGTVVIKEYLFKEEPLFRLVEKFDNSNTKIPMILEF
jgi:hypothetical protein